MTEKFVAKLAILVAAIAAAFFLTIYQPEPVGVGGRTVRAAPGTPASKLRDKYDLTSMKIFNQTLVKIRDQYVDPTRIDPKNMLLAALDSVQRNIAEVLVEPNRDKDEVVVTVNDKTKKFSISEVDSVWRLASTLKRIFDFVQANMNPGSDAAQIEYAAVNGMLGTLDPHSVLLDPENAREMDIKTSGKFGGIGIVIGMRKGKLMVIKLISDDTPAAKVGLKANDHILKINDEATENLTITEAMNRLRGDPRSKVLVTVQRKGEDAPRPFQITRDLISVSEVESKLLAGNVGYVKIKSFQALVEHDLKEQMDKLKKQGARAWVLDLRGNPGGLLDQSVRVVDMFVESGTIVSTVGYAGKQRKEERAEADGADSKAPLAVLVNGGSASASEIVAGALKNLDRAVILGRTTFGKGSVQVLFDFDDDSKLKLTIAQYLTPGDVSIQSVGITPDIELMPVVVPTADEFKQEPKGDARPAQVNLRGAVTRMREADLESHLTSKNSKSAEAEKPGDTVRYLWNAKENTKVDADEEQEDAAMPDDEAPPEDDFVEDWEIKFARDYVAEALVMRRRDMLTQRKSFVTKRRGEEDAKIAEALKGLAIDWSADKATGAKLAAVITTDKAANEVKAGDIVSITGTVTNNGTGPAFQVRAHAETDDYTFENTELVFGKVDAGASKTFTARVRVHKAAESRVDGINWLFSEANGTRVDVERFKVAVKGRPRPQFAYTYQLIDSAGNGDGLLQPGESLKLLVTAKNVGDGKSGAEEVSASLRNASGDGVVLNKARFPLTDLEPGASKSMEFTFDVKKDFAPEDKTLVLELSIYDAGLREGLTDKLKFPLRGAAAGPRAESSAVKVSKKDAEVRSGAELDAPIIGTVKKGAVLKVTGREADWVRVELEGGRPGFIANADVSKSSGGTSSGVFSAAWQVTPPAIALNVASLETTGEKWRLSGTASDDHHVEDVFVIVSNRDSKIDGKKVYYLSNRNGKSHSKLDFSAEVPVWPGSNLVTVVARESNDVRTVQSVFIWRSDGIKSASVSR